MSKSSSLPDILFLAVRGLGAVAGLAMVAGLLYAAATAARYWPAISV